MEVFPELHVGWLNGWTVIVLLRLTDGILFLAFPKKVVRRLWDRSGWSPTQQVFTIVGKLFGLGCLALLVFTPINIGKPVCWAGVIVTVLGLLGMIKALFDFKNTPLEEPVTRGLYRISRHPQIVMSSLVILGGCIMIGSWAGVAFWAAARLMEHIGVLAEEEICLKQYGESYRAYLKQVPRYFVFF